MEKDHLPIKGTPNTFDDFKSKQRKCMKYCFLICKSLKHILKVYSINYTLR